MQRIACALFILLATLLPARPCGWQTAAAAVVHKSIAVTMRDGVTLRADVMLPSGKGRFPVLVYRTPYGKDRAPREWTTFQKAVERGYAVVIEDVRGR